MAASTDAASRRIIQDLVGEVAPNSVSIIFGMPCWEGKIRDWVASHMKVSDYHVSIHFIHFILIYPLLIFNFILNRYLIC